jgi:hypothetical protein
MTEKKYDDTNRGAIFKNDRKEKENDRDYSGSLNVDGHDYWISGWIKEGRNGGKFLSLSVKRKEGKPEQKQRPKTEAESARRSMSEMNDEIPFAPEWR